MNGKQAEEIFVRLREYLHCLVESRLPWSSISIVEPEPLEAPSSSSRSRTNVIERVGYSRGSRCVLDW